MSAERGKRADVCGCSGAAGRLGRLSVQGVRIFRGQKRLFHLIQQDHLVGHSRCHELCSALKTRVAATSCSARNCGIASSSVGHRRQAGCGEAGEADIRNELLQLPLVIVGTLFVRVKLRSRTRAFAMLSER